MELLAPAGGMKELKAALESGADAVYLGLDTLNARRGAKNFTQDEIVDAVEQAHAVGVRVFLALNIDLATREIGAAARMLELAKESKVDAVIFTDAAILELKKYYPELEFHFSTQASVSSSAGMRAAASLGVDRAVLARELTTGEIIEAAKVDGIEAEVFVQGALCMCVSGRCLLSSWGGGRSGNRGACTSPCRVRWSDEFAHDMGTILAMRDLCAVEHLPAFEKAGVASLKIEGRLKNAGWVSQAVSLYRRSLSGADVKTEIEAELGAYAGREMTAGYLEGRFDQMTGEYGREASDEDEQAVVKTGTPDLNVCEYNLRIDSSGQKLDCELDCEFGSEKWQQVKTVVKREKRAVTLDEAGQWLGQFKIQGAQLGEFACDDPEFMVPRKTVNLLADKISSALHQLKKSKSKKKLQMQLPEQVRELVCFEEDTSNNPSQLGHKPNMVRISWLQAEEFLEDVSPELVVVEDVSPEDLPALKVMATNSILAISLPWVFYEEDIEGLKKLCAACSELGLMVEVNGWDGWWLAKDAGLKVIGGPGMAVLNPLAASALNNIGFSAVSYSLEAGRKQYEDLSINCTAAGIMTVYSKPILAVTRAGITESERLYLEDARGIKLEVYKKHGLYYLRAAQSYDLSAIKNEHIRARYLCADLCGVEKPVKQWKNMRKQRKSSNLFNYERGLY